MCHSKLFGLVKSLYQTTISPKIQSLGAQSYEIFGFSGRGIGPGTVLGTAMAKYLMTEDEAYLPMPITKDYSDRSRAGKLSFLKRHLVHFTS